MVVGPKIDQIVLIFVSIFILFAAGESSAQNGKIAFGTNRAGTDEIFVMNADGTDQVRLTTGRAPIWSTDGRRIAFIDRNGRGTGSIFIMNADGTGRSEVTEDPYGPPSWSPDGRKLVFSGHSDATGGGIVMVNVDGSERRFLTTGAEDLDPVWSPDGSKILFTRYGIYPPFGYGGTMLHAINTDGTDLRPLANGFADGWNEDLPRWSATVNKIIYQVNQWDFDTSLFIAKPDGTDRQLFDGCPSFACGGDYRTNADWSPNGRIIVFTISDRFRGESEIYIKNIDGTGFRQLTNTPGSNYAPSWQRLVFTVSGRVTTPGGAGLRNAVVSMLDGENIRTTTTSSFGFFTFDGVEAGRTYTLTAASRRYRFAPRLVQVDGDLSNVDLVGQE